MTGQVLCKRTAELFGGNTINGRLFLELEVIFRGRSVVQSSAYVLVGRGSVVEPLSAFNNRIVFGEGNKIGSDGIFNAMVTGKNVNIGSNGSLSGTFGDGVKVGDRCTTLRDTVMEDEASLGTGVMLGQRVRVLKGMNVGDGCCIGDDVTVNQSVPADSIWNQGEAIRSITRAPGTTITRTSDGKCVEQNRRRSVGNE